jgi:hypothetical protein
VASQQAERQQDPDAQRDRVSRELEADLGELVDSLVEWAWALDGKLDVLALRLGPDQMKLLTAMGVWERVEARVVGEPEPDYRPMLPQTRERLRRDGTYDRAKRSAARLVATANTQSLMFHRVRCAATPRMARPRPRGRRSPRATRAGPDDGGPEPAGPGDPVGATQAFSQNTSPAGAGLVRVLFQRLPGRWSGRRKERLMRSLDLQDMPFSGRTSRPGAQLGATTPDCSRCGTPLGGRKVGSVRKAGMLVQTYVCGCGRRRLVRREVAT